MRLNLSTVAASVLAAVSVVPIGALNIQRAPYSTKELTQAITENRDHRVHKIQGDDSLIVLFKEPAGQQNIEDNVPVFVPSVQVKEFVTQPNIEVNEPVSVLHVQIEESDGQTHIEVKESAAHPHIEVKEAAHPPVSVVNETPGRYHSIKVVNSCRHTIWPALFGPINEGFGEITTPEHQGFRLDPGSFQGVPIPHDWNGRVWAREHCTFDENGLGRCAIGDCDGKLHCMLSGQPTSLAEFNFKGNGKSIFYDISLVDGYNVGIGVYAIQNDTIIPELSPVCNLEGKDICPDKLRLQPFWPVHETTNFSSIPLPLELAKGRCLSLCKSAPIGVHPEYCCVGKHATPDTCFHNSYSAACKSACPDAYSYPYNDFSSSFIADQSDHWDFIVEFCPKKQSSSIRKAKLDKENLPFVPLKEPKDPSANTPSRHKA
ncbi:Osmotin, thaumatin-like protein [Ascodesmis nigricans]|uniref:Osmotin, thaumatin-like protein n=1 Tax=Ascodesmis nigricans TaxID=341454 RepID=A0A4S2MYI7_9PEZI|nr:Osmotin, thaumatin-like protein [Ascodesmis nigricans]